MALFSFSFAIKKVPWGGKSNPEVIDGVLKGERLPKPESCPDELYATMMKCWQPNPDDRPSFGELLTELLAFAKTSQKTDTPPASPASDDTPQEK
jgi:hypothetical protein